MKRNTVCVAAVVLASLCLTVKAGAEPLLSWRFTATVTSVDFAPDSSVPPIPSPLAVGDTLSGAFWIEWYEPHEWVPWRYTLVGGGVGITDGDVTQQHIAAGEWRFADEDPLYGGPGGISWWGNGFMHFVGADLPATLGASSFPLPQSGSYYGDIHLDGAGDGVSPEDGYLGFTAELSDFTPVPGPSSLVVLGTGLLGLVLRRRRG